MIVPNRAPVKPRVVSPETHEHLLLEDVVEACVALRECGPVELLGGPGTGKSTALAHLASLTFADRLLLLDDASPRDLEVVSTDRLVVYATRETLNLTDACYELAPWSTDDAIEYLLAAQPDRCSSVMARFSADGDRDLLEGTAALYCRVLEQMAASDQLRNIRTALRRAIAEWAADEQTLEDSRYYAASLLLKEPQLAESTAREMLGRGVARPFIGFLGSRMVQVLLTADRVISLLKGNPEYPFPAHRLPRDLVREVARLVHDDPTALDRLRELFEAGETRYMPMIASVLHALDARWRPSGDRYVYLCGAYLSEAPWQSIELHQVNLEQADLRGSDLRDALLNHARLDQATLRGIHGERAHFAEVRAAGADFDNADLHGADLSKGQFRWASFAGADLRGAIATNANFGRVDFKGASLQGALLKGCSFRGASLEDVDLRDADLRGARLSRQVLRTANLLGANLEGASLFRCDLEFVEWPAARLSTANLTDAYLTGSRMTGADLRKARLKRAGLADIEWEEADLRLADLRECSFHMGSSRSGLVGSPYPGHGSRTGFYTNDYDDQSYKAPEEIRKANLCGADLRGALINGVDFYLVDLRGAKYDQEQEAHLRFCDAILESRAP